MKKIGSKRGSVLMEFIIVFPIYLVLFAGTVAIGDMLIHSNRLVSADRVAAFGVEGWAETGWNWLTQNVFHPGREIADDGTNQDRLNQVQNPHYAEDSGPWTVCAAATARDRYKPLAGGTLGQLLSAQVLLGTTATGDLQTWANGSRVAMRSRSTDVTDCHYVLKRRRDVMSWRDMTSGLLRNDWWRSEVANEAWFGVRAIEEGASDCQSAKSASVDEYERYLWPVGWE